MLEKRMRTLSNMVCPWCSDLAEVSRYYTRYTFILKAEGMLIQYSNSQFSTIPEKSQSAMLQDLNQEMKAAIAKYNLPYIGRFIQISDSVYDFELIDVSLLPKGDQLVDVMTI